MKRKPRAPQSFAAATKHLFRHLHETEALRSNPLVEHFFTAPTSHNLDRLQRDRAAHERIRALVREAAERWRAADERAGREERAIRQYTIVVLHILERRPIREIAQMLAISAQQCYRERAEAARRIAQHLARCPDRATPQLPVDLDEFGLLIECTRRSAPYRESTVAFEQCDDLVCAAESASQRVEALRVAGLIALGFGRVDRAEAALAAARRCTEEFANGGDEGDIARAGVDLLECDLAFHRADSHKALQHARSAVERLERIDGAARVTQLYVESLYELTASLWNVGRLPEANANIVRANAMVAEAPALPAPLRARVAVGLWKTRNHLLVSSESWCPAARRIEGLLGAFEVSRAAGLSGEAADALVALIQCYAFTGEHEQSLRAARLAAVLASRHASVRTRNNMAIQIAMALLESKHWAFGLSLMRAQTSDSYDPYHREIADYFRAEQAFRRDAPADAWNIASTPGNATAYPALAVKRQLIAAAAAHRLERRREALAFVDAALPAAERIGSAPILRDAYAVAARVTGDARLRRNAGEVSRLLTA